MKLRLLLLFNFAWISMTPVKAQILKHSYRFYENFQVAQPECGSDLVQAEALGNCNAAATAGSYLDDVLPCGVQRKVYHNNLNWGLMYPNTTGEITDNYTIQMYIKVTEWGKINTRLIDFSNGQRDQGIYFQTKNGSSEHCIDAYPYGIAGICSNFDSSTYYLLTFTRNGKTGILDVYVDNTLVASFNDSGGIYTSKAGTPIYIFRDDISVSCESGQANFAYLSFSNQYSSQSNVSEIVKEICYSASINASADFSINPIPVCSISKNTTVTYTGDIPVPGTGYAFEWNFNGGTIISGNGMGPFVVNWNTPGTKNVTLTITNVACKNSIVNTKQILVGDLELTPAVLPGTCTNPLATIMANAAKGAPPYQYSIDSVHYQADPVFKVSPKTYQVYVKDANNCVLSKEVTTDPVGAVSIKTINDTTICEGQQVQLFSTSINAVTFSWLPAKGLDNGSVKDPVANPAVTTQYIITASKDDCIAKDTVNVTVTPKIEVTITPDTEIEASVPFQLNSSSPQLAGQAGISYAWLPPMGLDKPTIANPIATITLSTTYSVKITSATGCSGMSSVNLRVIPPPSIFIPTAFTPDGDGKNEILKPIINNIKSLTYFKIYNRWGEVVFSSNQANQGWDGRFKGAEPVSGTYVFKVEGITDQDKTITKEGSFLLIR